MQLSFFILSTLLCLVSTLPSPPTNSDMHSDKRLKMAGNSVATQTSLGSTDSTKHPSTESLESSESSGSSGAQQFKAPRRPGFRVQRHHSALEDAAKKVREWDSRKGKDVTA
jgi:hypothetical protein